MSRDTERFALSQRNFSSVSLASTDSSVSSIDDEDRYSDRWSVSTGRYTWTPDIGMMSGKVILAVGEAELKLIKFAWVRYRRRVLSRRFPHTSADAKKLDKRELMEMYDDLLDFSRDGLYTPKINEWAIGMFKQQIETSYTDDFTSSIKLVPSDAQVQILGSFYRYGSCGKREVFKRLEPTLADLRKPYCSSDRAFADPCSKGVYAALTILSEYFSPSPSSSSSSSSSKPKGQGDKWVKELLQLDDVAWMKYGLFVEAASTLPAGAAVELYKHGIDVSFRALQKCSTSRGAFRSSGGSRSLRFSASDERKWRKAMASRSSCPASCVAGVCYETLASNLCWLGWGLRGWLTGVEERRRGDIENSKARSQVRRVLESDTALKVEECVRMLDMLECVALLWGAPYRDQGQCEIWEKNLEVKVGLKGQMEGYVRHTLKMQCVLSTMVPVRR